MSDSEWIDKLVKIQCVIKDAVKIIKNWRKEIGVSSKFKQGFNLVQEEHSQSNTQVCYKVKTQYVKRKAWYLSLSVGVFFTTIVPNL